MDQYKIDIKNYKIGDLLGGGAFGEVYKVQDKKTKQVCAAKFIKVDDEEQLEEQKESINREIQVMIKVQHPTMLKFIGYTTQDFNGKHGVTIFTKIAKGGSLSSICYKDSAKRKGLKYDATARQCILAGIARGMMILHQNQGMHRDLKPDNVLLDDKLYPHISDFGLSKIMDNGNELMQSKVCGDAIYIAPECLRGPVYNQKCDVYSFAILMFEVITESHCYPSDPALLPIILLKVADGARPQFKTEVKPGLKKLIERCWDQTPNNRPTFEAIFKALAFNNEEDLPIDIFENEDDDDEDSKNDDDNDNKYYLDGVDVKRLRGYIDCIYKEDEDAPTTLEALAARMAKMEKEMKSMKYSMKKLIDENKKIRYQLGGRGGQHRGGRGGHNHPRGDNKPKH